MCWSNNAGYDQSGAIEEVSDDQIQRMYDVNVFGALRMIRAVVPYMRSQKARQIINISSIAGKMVTPVNGCYSSTKFALEALSDALRMEVEPFGIQVILVEPVAIKTSFDRTVHTHGDEILCNPKSPYFLLYRKHQQVSDSMRQQEPGPQVVSQAIQKAMETRKPASCYLAGAALPTRLVLTLGNTAWNFVVKRLYKLSPQG